MRDGEVPVIDVEVVGAVGKTVRGTFSVPVQYTLDDGTVVLTTVARTRKRDVLPAASELNDAAAAGRVRAAFRDGEFVCTAVRYGR